MDGAGACDVGYLIFVLERGKRAEGRASLDVGLSGATAALNCTSMAEGIAVPTDEEDIA